MFLKDALIIRLLDTGLGNTPPLTRWVSRGRCGSGWERDDFGKNASNVGVGYFSHGRTRI
jgi:hypothetical protein